MKATLYRLILLRVHSERKKPLSGPVLLRVDLRALGVALLPRSLFLGVDLFTVALLLLLLLLVGVLLRPLLLLRPTAFFSLDLLMVWNAAFNFSLDSKRICSSLYIQ